MQRAVTGGLSNLGVSLAQEGAEHAIYSFAGDTRASDPWNIDGDLINGLIGSLVDAAMTLNEAEHAAAIARGAQDPRAGADAFARIENAALGGEPH